MLHLESLEEICSLFNILPVRCWWRTQLEFSLMTASLVFLKMNRNWFKYTLICPLLREPKEEQTQ